MNKKKFLTALTLALCAIKTFSAEPGKVVAEVPEEVMQDPLFQFSGFGDDSFDYIYKIQDEVFINADGKKIGPFDNVTGLRRAGKNFCYVYSDGKGKNHFVLNEEEVGAYDNVHWFYIDKEYGKFTLFARDNEKWFIVTDEKTYGPFEKRPEFFMQKDDGSICYCVEEDGFDYVYTDGKKRGPYVFASSIAPPLGIGKVDRFAYTWATPEDVRYYLCIDGKEFGPYNSIDAIKSDDGKVYYIAGSVDFKSIYIACEGKILKELNAEAYYSSARFGSGCDGALSINLLGNYFNGNTCFLLKDGKIIAEIKEELRDPDPADGNPLAQMFPEKWIKCPTGRFGPFESIYDLLFDEKGHAIWSGEDDSGKCGLYVDGKLIYESDRTIDFSDFKMKGDDFLFVMGNYFNTLVVNGREYHFEEGSVFYPDFVPGTDGFTFLLYRQLLLEKILCYGGKFYRASLTENAVHYIDENKIRKLSLSGDAPNLLKDLLSHFM